MTSERERGTNNKHDIDQKVILDQINEITVCTNITYIRQVLVVENNK